ncbi:beta strand repeat-containing protein [Singulisphaera sp. GP187]|uniref:beta strand repeat-containing protein n=1 Tax=Singulisphaera sp. GP187 TaxID=1882752 RepID=UPI0009413799|nr:Ig-like domain repeat protein [Singulisphaera sp. GP187]
MAPATSIWNGAVDGLWSTAGNWDTPPTAGSDLVFPNGAGHLANTNDLAVGTSFASFTVSGGGYAIGGAAINLAGLLDASHTSGTDTINLPINFTGSTTVEVDQAGAVLVLGGVLTTEGLNKTGAGELNLTAANPYTGNTTVAGGVLVVDGPQGGSPVVVNAGASLRGSGTVGAITAVSGTVRPGNAGPAILTSHGNLTLDAASTYAVALNGTTAGTDYSQLGVNGQISLGNATLQTTLGYTPAGHDQLLILNNTGAAAINGTFAGLPQGATVVVANEAFQISYTGGDGNDVVLTHLLGSTTTVTAAPNSTVFGQTVLLTATVAASAPGQPNSPTGTVEFFSGTTSLGTATLNAGTAILSTFALPTGTDTVTAKYKGDADFGPSTSPGFTVTVAQASTVTSLSVTPTTAVIGQSVTLTSTVAAASPGSGTPTGTVEFFSGTTSLGTATLNNGVATFSTTNLPLGNDSITAKYLGSTDYAANTSAPVIATVSQASTITTLTTAPNPSSVGQPTLLTATIAAVSPGTGLPTGTVEFFNGTTSLGTGTLSNGVATLSTSVLPLGTSTLTARYLGDANYIASTSAAKSQTVSPATTTTLNANPTSVAFGATVTLTATVAPVSGTGTLTGNVIFMSGTTPLGTAAVIGGVATLKTNTIPGGSNAITAQYQGDTNFGGSTSTAVNVTVAKVNTTSTLKVSPLNSGLGNPVTLTATITSTSTSTVKPSGTVRFLDGAVLLGTATVDSNGIATLTSSSLTLGSHSITAQYEGDGNFNSSISPAVTQNVGQLTTTTLSVNPNASVFGQAVVLTSTITSTAAGTPTGTVEFFSGTTSLGTATLNNGVATLTTTALPTGVNSAITAVYSGDPTFGTSTSTARTVTVTKADTTIAVAVKPNPAGFGQQWTLTANIVAASPGSGTPTGTVQFYSNGIAIGSVVNVVNGVATLLTSATPQGASTITARYSGDANFLTRDAATTASVTQSNSTVDLSSSDLNPSAREAITLTARVAASNGGTIAPTGTVRFFSNGVLIGSGTLTNGVATLVTTALSVGVDTITAVYQGDSNFTSSSSPALTVVSGTQTERFLNQVYINSNGRPATLDELDFYRTQLAIGVPRHKVVARIVNSPNGQAHAVTTVYRTFLRREPTFREVLRGLQSQKKSQGFGAEIDVLGSHEYYQTQGGGTIDGFLTALYADVLGTAIPSSAQARLSRELRQGVSRASVASSVVLSQPGKSAFVTFLYQQFFATTPTTQQRARSVGILNRGGFVNQVVTDLLSSNDFYNQFSNS